MPGHTRVRPITGGEDIPLPGMYPVITTQLNITAYQSGKAGRFVVVTRLPSDAVELGRAFCEVADWSAVAQEAQRALEHQLRDVEYLMGFGKGI